MRPVEDWEYPEPDDEADDESATVECPACGAEMYEDSPQCAACGEYITPSISVLSGRPMWFVLLALLGIVAVIAVFLRW
jgi:hypothetical protein